jgi:EpsI family protein
MGAGGVTKRLLALAGVLACGVAAIKLSAHRVLPARPRTFADFPSAIGEWRGREVMIESRILKSLGADDLLNRVYDAPNQPPLGLFIAYYASQRIGTLIHSPKHCLPGTGWEPVQTDQLLLERSGSGPVVVNEYIVQKGPNRQYVLYWYEGRGRTIASEYWLKLFTIEDALLRGRTDCALVRLTTSMGEDEVEARARASRFAKTIAVPLGSFIPK